MGFSNNVLAVLKKIGCMREPLVQENTYATLAPYQADEEVEAVHGASHIQTSEGKEEVLKGETIKDKSSEPKENENSELGEEKPKSEEACAVASELKGEESKSEQAAATVNESKHIEEDQTIAREQIKE